MFMPVYIVRTALPSLNSRRDEIPNYSILILIGVSF
jgi:hypothetical protein